MNVLADTFRIFPRQTSINAGWVDDLFFFELAVSVFFTGLIFVLVVYFGIRYRRRAPGDYPTVDVQNTKLEITWCIVPFLIMLVMFFWGTHVYARMKTPPANAITINVMGKQWMWHIEHSDGTREINALHVPVGQPVRLIMGSQDVIHSFFIPEFRIKQDVVPGTFTEQWFVAKTAGTYHLFCTQYCGTEHAKMIGTVTAMEPADFAAWLNGVPKDIPPAAAGAQLFQTWGCSACHGQRAPTLAGLYMTQVKLDDGSSVLADDNYLRESIVEPAAKVVAGYPPVMPSYRGQLTEEQLMALVAYIKSLGAAAAPDGVRLTPSTQPVNGQTPDHVPNFPPARNPPAIGVPGEANPSARGIERGG